MKRKTNGRSVQKENHPLALTRRRAPAERQREIMQAAIKLFARDGFERTTTKAIAKEAKIAEGTIYRHFKSKQHLLFAFVSEIAVNPLTEILGHEDQRDDEAVMRTLMRNRFDIRDRMYELMKVVFSEALFNPDLAEAQYQNVARPAIQTFEAYLRRRMRDGAFRRDLKTPVAARLLIGYVFASLLMWDSVLGGRDAKISREALAEELTRLFLDGVRCHGSTRKSRK